MASTRTHYDMLGIEPGADDAAVRKAWKVLIQVWHPDRFTGEMRAEAEAQTARINEAWHVLRDSSRRSAYDRRIASSAEPGSGGATSERRAPFSQGFTGRTPQAGTGHAGPARTGTGTAVPASAAAGDSLTEFATAAVAAARRHPRATAAACILWLLLVVAGPVRDHLNRPSLPSPALATRSIAATPDPVATLRALDAESRDLDATDETTGALPSSAGADSPTIDGPAPDAGGAYAPLPEPAPQRVIRVMPKARVTGRR